MRVSSLARLIGIVLPGLFFSVFAGLNANAVPITFEFTATVNSGVPADLTGTFSSGQLVSGSYTFESTAPDVDPGSAIFGTYENVSSYSFSIAAASYSGSASPGTGTQSARITAGNGESGSDTYRVVAFEPVETVSGADVGGLSLISAILFMSDPTETAFSDDSLPLTPPSLGDFAVGEFILGFSDGQTNADLVSTLTSLRIRPTGVPEPGAFALLTVGLLGIGVARLCRRNRRSCSA